MAPPLVVSVLPPRPSKIRLDRLALGLKMFPVCQGVGCSEATLSRLERGQIVRPELEKRVRAWLAQQRKASA